MIFRSKARRPRVPGQPNIQGGMLRQDSDNQLAVKWRSGNLWALDPIQNEALVVGHGWRRFVPGRIQGGIDLYSVGVYRWQPAEVPRRSLSSVTLDSVWGR